MKVQILMPTFNDGKYIEKSIESVLKQKGVDLELIIINDGSSDNTESLVLSYGDERIKYIKQENRGQLDALLNGSKFLTGDFVCLFHSDDLVTDEYAFYRNIEYILENDLDGVYADYIKINETDQETGIIKVHRNFGEETLKKLIHYCGSNPIGDPFFLKREKFLKYVLERYIFWNQPYWFTIEGDEITFLKLKYSNTPWYKYRVFGENYIKSEVGKFVASNGVIRTIIDLSKFYRIWFLNFRYVHRLPTKLIVHKTKSSYETYRKQIYILINKIFKSYNINTNSNIYYEAILNFYNLRSNLTLEIVDTLIEETPIFLGKDVNIFYNMLTTDKLPELYKLLIRTALSGSFDIAVNIKYEKKIKTILKFINFDTNIVFY